MTPAYSVIIPACNEERWLPRTLEFLRRAMAEVPEPGEIIVCDNASSDRTAALAAAAGARVVSEAHRQISRARNRGAEAARGEFLIFLDADTLVEGALLRQALDHLRNKGCGGGARVAMDGDCPPRLLRGLRAWNRISAFLRVAAGCFVFCHRQAFEESGGFSESVYAGEEVWFSDRLKRWGRRRGLRFAILSDPPVRTSPRRLHRTWKMAGTLVLLVLFPFASRSRFLCGYWYAEQRD